VVRLPRGSFIARRSDGSSTGTRVPLMWVLLRHDSEEPVPKLSHVVRGITIIRK
jgi:hypothetical protein